MAKVSLVVGRPAVTPWNSEESGLINHSEPKSLKCTVSIVLIKCYNWTRGETHAFDHKYAARRCLLKLTSLKTTSVFHMLCMSYTTCNDSLSINLNVSYRNSIVDHVQARRQTAKRLYYLKRRTEALKATWLCCFLDRLFIGLSAGREAIRRALRTAMQTVGLVVDAFMPHCQLTRAMWLSSQSESDDRCFKTSNRACL